MCLFQGPPPQIIYEEWFEWLEGMGFTEIAHEIREALAEEAEQRQSGFLREQQEQEEEGDVEDLPEGLVYASESEEEEFCWDSEEEDLPNPFEHI